MLFNAGVFQSWAPGTLGGDERREAGDPDDTHPSLVPRVPDAGGVQEDDGEEVMWTPLTPPPCPAAGGRFLLLVLGRSLTASFCRSFIGPAFAKQKSRLGNLALENTGRSTDFKQLTKRHTHSKGNGSSADTPSASLGGQS